MVNGYKPAALAEALEIRAKEAVVPYAGGTDLMVRRPEGVSFLFLNDIQELKQITDDGAFIRIGAAVTFTQALNCELLPPLMKEAVSRIAAPAIRNAGTFGGNLGNGSDKADSVLAASALDAKVRLLSKDGERLLSVEEFNLSRGVTALRDDELIAEVLLPKETCALPYYYQKVGGRSALAISRVALAGVYEIRDGVIVRFSAAFIGAGMPRRCCEAETAIIGQPIDAVKANPEAFLQPFAEKLQFTRGRVSAEYRRTVILNLLRDYIETL